MIGCWWRYGQRRHDARPVTIELDGGVESNQSSLDLAEFGEKLPQFLRISIKRCRVRGVSFEKKKKLLYVAVVVVIRSLFSSSSLESSFSLSHHLSSNPSLHGQP